MSTSNTSEFISAFAGAAESLGLAAPAIVGSDAWYCAASASDSVSIDGRTELPDDRLADFVRDCSVAWVWNEEQRRMLCLLGPLVDPGMESLAALSQLIAEINLHHASYGHIVWEHPEGDDPGGGIAITSTIVATPEQLNPALLGRLLDDVVFLATVAMDGMFDAIPERP